MRHLFSFNMISLDGFFDGATPWDLSWHNVDAEFNEFAIEQMQTIGTLIFGRITYEGMASYWPSAEAITSDPAIAGLMNNVPKIVFSRTLEKAEWSNTRLVKTDVRDEILQLKNESSKDLAVFGSADLLATLIQLDLVDEHRVMVNPVILGQGAPLFKKITGQANLKLVRSRTFNSGNVLLCYEPIKN